MKKCIELAREYYVSRSYDMQMCHIHPHTTIFLVKVSYSNTTDCHKRINSHNLVI